MIPSICQSACCIRDVHIRSRFIRCLVLITATGLFSAIVLAIRKATSFCHAQCITDSAVLTQDVLSPSLHNVTDKADVFRFLR